MWWNRKKRNKKKPIEFCSHTNKVYFDKDETEGFEQFVNNSNGTTTNRSVCYIDFQLCYCKECGKKYVINTHYSFPIVREATGDILEELDKKLLFPIRIKKLEKILNEKS